LAIFASPITTSQMPPTITLRSTCYNQASFVIESLDSVARQDHAGFEWIIVDDASTDRSASLISEWLDRNRSELLHRGTRVEFVRHTANHGFPRTLNEILEMASGEYLMGLACDDRMLPQRISSAVRALSELPDGYAGLYGDAYLIDAAGRRGAQRFIESCRTFEEVPDGDIFEPLLQENFIPVPAACVRTELLREVGGYDESLAYVDYDLWLRLSRRYKFAYLAEPQVEYRLHPNNFHKRITDWNEISYWIYRKHIDDERGADRFVRSVASLHRQRRLTHEILTDLDEIELSWPRTWPPRRLFLQGGTPSLLHRFRAGMMRRFPHLFSPSDFVFIHINKTAGCSIESALHLETGHWTAAEKIAAIGPVEWSRKFSFAFVRNPWDKVVSQYHYRLRVEKLGPSPPEFREWVRVAFGEEDPDHRDDPRLFMSQYDWLVDNEGNLVVEFVGRFENLREHFRRVCEILRVSPELPHLNRTRHGHYRDYYDQESRAIIERVFRKDLEEFGYDF